MGQPVIPVVGSTTIAVSISLRATAMPGEYLQIQARTGHLGFGIQPVGGVGEQRRQKGHAALVDSERSPPHNPNRIVPERPFRIPKRCVLHKCWEIPSPPPNAPASREFVVALHSRG